MFLQDLAKMKRRSLERIGCGVILFADRKGMVAEHGDFLQFLDVRSTSHCYIWTNLISQTIKGYKKYYKW